MTDSIENLGKVRTLVDQKSYTNWKTDIQQVASINGLAKHLDGTSTSPPTQISFGGNSEQERWEKKDLLLKRLIFASIATETRINFESTFDKPAAVIYKAVQAYYKRLSYS